jgi:hypothetical protein
MWTIWHTPPDPSLGTGTSKTYKHGIYTSGCSNQKYGGWSQEGINFFSIIILFHINEKFAYAVKNWKKSWAPKVE